MALIEGVGDEVLQVFACIFLIIIGVVSWWSTQISERHVVRTVLILERRGNRQSSGETPSAPAELPPPPEEKPAEVPPLDEPSENTTRTDLSSDVVTIASPVATVEADATETCEGEVNAVRNKRLAYYDEGATSNDSANACSVEPEKENDNLSPPVEVPVTEDAPDSQPSQPNNIRIRLKYLDDQQKLVEGSLNEQLGEFKRRHFSLELSGRKLVRLIFNGQLLGQDTCTLGHYGLFDNCVVHCLVHNPRTPPPSPNLNAREGSARQGPLTAWALSNILLAGLSLLLGLAWYGRYHYAHLYTATTTVALVGLTGLFTVSLIGMYMPDIAQP